MEDHEGERLLIMCGTVINRIKLKECAGCGAYFAPIVYLKHVLGKITVPGPTPIDNLCSSCKKIAHGFRMSGVEPEFPNLKDTSVSPIDGGA